MVAKLSFFAFQIEVWFWSIFKLKVLNKEYIKTIINLVFQVLDDLKNVSNREPKSIPVELPFFII